MEQAAQSAQKIGQEDLAERYAREALEFHRQNGDVAGIGRTGLILGTILADVASYDQAVVDLEGLLGEHELIANPEMAGVAAELAPVYGVLGRPEAAILMADAGGLAAGRLGMTPLVVRTLITKGTTLCEIGQVEEGVAVLQDALERAIEHDLVDLALRARNNLAVVIEFDDPPPRRKPLPIQYQKHPNR